ncbi:hypothetical protein ACJET8_005194 [Citrobacter farmeri]
MSTITRERLLKIQQWRETYGPGSNVVLPAEEAEELARIALASLEAEPVAYMHRSGQVVTREECCDDKTFAICCKVEKPLYTSQPALVSVPDAISTRQAIAKMENHDPCDSINVAYKFGWNACRAAMLQGSQPVSQSDELPLDYLHGHKDGLEWAAQLAEANHPQTGDWLYDDPTELAKAIRKGPDMPPVESGNSPVIPDEVLSAIRKVARIRTDLDDFDGDRRGIADCLDEAEQELIVTINEHAAMLQTGNDSTTGKPLTITLPDITSKAFWSGTGKSETFHPETYKRWVKEAIERACVITGIRVVVK